MEILTGKENFELNGKSVGFNMLDFWKFEFSNIYDMQDEISEFIVAKALEIDVPYNKEMWTLYDILASHKAVKPLSIMFSEYYFYLIAWMADDSKDYPTVFRIDRMTNVKSTEKKYSIPYKDRFEEGDFRKKVQFMFSGPLKTIRFEFSGPSLEAILDRIPAAEIIAQDENKTTIIEDSHMLNVAEVPMYNLYNEFALRFKDNAINLFLPRIEINKNIREYIAEELGLILYKVLKTKFDEEFIQHELYRYIPDARREELRTKQLFVKYFYQVILYQERKPGIYTKFDDHMRRVIILEFYKRIITAYLDKTNR